MVLMKHPAIGMKLQMKTKSDWRPMPGMASRYIPKHVSPVFTKAMRDCTHQLIRAARMTAHLVISATPQASDELHDSVMLMVVVSDWQLSSDKSHGRPCPSACQPYTCQQIACAMLYLTIAC